jgi:nicotinamidase/pyrazinamidase
MSAQTYKTDHLIVDPVELYRHGDALLAVDVQKDFCSGGALAIEKGDTVVPMLNNWIEMAFSKSIPVYASRDWHPVNHTSFKDQGGDWPPHCIQDTDGARFHPSLKLPDNSIVVTKGVRFDKDQLSVFDETGLADELRRRQVSHVWVGGLALDVCVRQSALDARRLGFQVSVLRQATRAVKPKETDDTLAQMQVEGIAVV